MNLKDKVVLITGGSRGIGAATALLAAKEGAKIVVNYNRSKKEAENIVQSIKTSGGNAVAIGADVSQREDLKKLVNQSIKTYGRIDVLINNAGVLEWGYFIKLTPEQIDRHLDINFRGVMHLTHSVLSHMQKRKDGVIVNIASGLGKHGMAQAALYSATKSAILRFTQSVASELIAHNIRIYAVCPGQTQTEMGDWAGTPVEKVANHIIKCAKEELGLSPGQDTEIYS